MTGDLTQALTVAYQLAGTATQGTEYANASGVVTFDADEAVAHVSIEAIDDAEIETAEFVALSLLTGTGYVVTEEYSATLNLLDNDGPIQPVNLTADTDANRLFNPADDLIEEDEIGKLVFVNSDDDDGNLVMDGQQTEGVAGENDLAEVKLTVPTEFVGTTVRLALLGDTAAARPEIFTPR